MASKHPQKKKTNRGKYINITNETHSASDLINELQYWLHCTSIRLDRCQKGPEPLVELLKNLVNSFENAFPFDLYYLLATSIVRLLQNIISTNCTPLTSGLIEAACQVYLHPNMSMALKWFSLKGIHCYDTLGDKTFIKSLGARKECFQKLALLITTLIKKQIVAVNYVNNIFALVFKHELGPVAFTEIAKIQKSITAETTDEAMDMTEKSRTTSSSTLGGRKCYLNC